MELDCESLESTFKSLQDLFSCKFGDLKDVLLSLDIDIFYQEHGMTIPIPSEDYLYNFVLDEFKVHKPLSSVCWFHLTKTFDGSLFINGILPLGDVLDEIWSGLISKSQNSKIKNNLIKLKKQNSSFLYNLKVSDRNHWGPYGVLVRSVAFNAESLSQHDYLKMPEIIEDICLEYESVYQESILEYYESILTPNIIKFRSSKQLDDNCIKSALFYAYRCVHSHAICGGAVTCFDGEGIAIPARDILSITKIDVTTPSTP